MVEKRDCCGVILTSLYQRIDSSNDPDSIKALVKFRGGYIINGKRLMPNENAYIAYQDIAAILDSNRDMLYFIHVHEKQDFLTRYPQYEGYPI